MSSAKSVYLLGYLRNATRQSRPIYKQMTSHGIGSILFNSHNLWDIPKQNKTQNRPCVHRYANLILDLTPNIFGA